MPKTTIHPPGEKLQKAIREFSDLLEKTTKKSRQQLLQEIMLKFDLSPSECAFLNRNLNEE